MWKRGASPRLVYGACHVPTLHPRVWQLWGGKAAAGGWVGMPRDNASPGYPRARAGPRSAIVPGNINSPAGNNANPSRAMKASLRVLRRGGESARSHRAAPGERSLSGSHPTRTPGLQEPGCKAVPRLRVCTNKGFSFFLSCK